MNIIITRIKILIYSLVLLISFLVKIDINKDVESLNISNSAAIVFHHLRYLKKNS